MPADTQGAYSSFDSGNDIAFSVTASPVYIFGGSMTTETSGDLFTRVGGLNVKSIVGGGYGKNHDGNTNVWVNNVADVGTVFGGGQSVFGSGGAVSGTARVLIEGVNSQIDYVYGGGNGAGSVGGTDVVIVDSYVAQVFGGGDAAEVEGDASVLIDHSGVVRLVGAGDNGQGVGGNVAIEANRSVVTEIYGAVDANVGGDIFVGISESQILGTIYAGVYDWNHQVVSYGFPLSDVDNYVGGNIYLGLGNVRIVNADGYDGFIYGAGNAKVDGDVMVEFVVGSESTQLADMIEYEMNILAGSRTFFNKSYGYVYSTQNVGLSLNGGYYTGAYVIAGNAVTAQSGYSYTEGETALTLSGGTVLEEKQAAGGAALADDAIVLTNAAALTLFNDVVAKDDGYGKNMEFIFAGGRTIGEDYQQYDGAVSLTGMTDTFIGAGSFESVYGGGYGENADVGFDFDGFDFAAPLEADFVYDDAFITDYKLSDDAAAVVIDVNNTDAAQLLKVTNLYGGGAFGSTVYGDVVMTLNVDGSDESCVENIFGGGHNENVVGDVDILVEDGSGLRNIFLGSFNQNTEDVKTVSGDGTITFTGDKNVSDQLKVYKNHFSGETLAGEATVAFSDYRPVDPDTGDAVAFAGAFYGYDNLAFGGDTSVILGADALTDGVTAETDILFHVTAETPNAADASEPAMFIYGGETPLSGVTDIAVSVDVASMEEGNRRVNLFDNFTFAEGTTTVWVEAAGGEGKNVTYFTDPTEDSYTVIGSVGEKMFVASVYHVDELLYMNYKIADAPVAADGLTVDFDYFKDKSVGALYFNEEDGKYYVLGEIVDNDAATARNTFDATTNGFRSLSELTSYIDLYEYQKPPKTEVTINIKSIKDGADATVNIGRTDYQGATRTQTWTGVVGDQVSGVYVEQINVIGNTVWDNEATIYVGQNGLAINYNNAAAGEVNEVTGLFLDGYINNNGDVNEVAIQSAGDLKLKMNIQNAGGDEDFEGVFNVAARNVDFTEFGYGDSIRTEFLNLGGETDITGNLFLKVGVIGGGLIEDTNAKFRLATGGKIETVLVDCDAYYTNGWTNNFTVENSGTINAFDFMTDAESFALLEQMWGPVMPDDTFPSVQDWYYYFYDGVTPDSDPNHPTDNPITTFLGLLSNSYKNLFITRMKGMHDVTQVTSFALTNNETGVIGQNGERSALEKLWSFGDGSYILNEGIIISNILSDDYHGADTIINEEGGMIGNAANHVTIKTGSTNDSLTNYGDIYADIDLGGGNNVFINRGNIYCVIRFGDGDDVFENSGLIDGVVDMGNGNNTFTLGDVGSVNEVTFGDGDDTFVNNGEISGLVEMGAGDNTFTNSATGTIDGSVNLGDVAGAGTNFTNQGTITGDVTAGDVNSSLTNDGTVGGTFDLGGGTENSLTNNGNIGSVTGGGSNDTVTNNGSIGSIDLGAGDNTVTNDGSITGSVEFGAGNDTFANSGTIGGSVTLGAGDDTVTLGGGSIGGDLNVGTGNDTIGVTNSSTVETVISEGDSLTLSGQKLTADVNFVGEFNVGSADENGLMEGNITGSAGNDTLNIYGTSLQNEAVAGGIQMGAGDDVVELFGSKFDLAGKETKIVASEGRGGYIYLGNGNNKVTLNEHTGIDRNIVAGAGNDEINILGGTVGTHIQAGAGDDVLTFNGGSIGGNVDMGAGNDTIQLGADLDLTNNPVSGRITAKGDLTIVGNTQEEGDAVTLTSDVEILGRTPKTLTAQGKLTIEGELENFETLSLEGAALTLAGGYSATFTNIVSDNPANSVTLNDYTLIWENAGADLNQDFAVNRDPVMGDGIFTVIGANYEANNYLGTFTDSVITGTFNGLSHVAAEDAQWFTFDGGTFGDIYAVNEAPIENGFYGASMLVTIQGADFSANLLDGGRGSIAGVGENGSVLDIGSDIDEMGAEVRNFDFIEVDYDISGLGDWFDNGEIVNEENTMTFADGKRLIAETFTLGSKGKVYGNVDGALLTFTKSVDMWLDDDNVISNLSEGEGAKAIQFSDEDDKLRFKGGTILGDIDMGGGVNTVYVYETFEQTGTITFGDGEDDSLYIFSNKYDGGGTVFTADLANSDGLDNLVIYNVADESGKCDTETTVYIDTTVSSALTVTLDFTQLNVVSGTEESQSYKSEYGVVLTDNADMMGVTNYTVKLATVLVYANVNAPVVLFSGVTADNFNLNASFQIECSWEDKTLATPMKIGDTARILNVTGPDYGLYELGYDETAGKIFIQKFNDPLEPGGFDLPIPDLNVIDDEISVAAADDTTLFNENNNKLAGFLA